MLGNYFTPPDQISGNKKKKLEWPTKFNSIRQKYSHPQRENSSEEEYTFLLETKDWLEKLLHQ